MECLEGSQKTIIYVLTHLQCLTFFELYFIFVLMLVSCLCLFGTLALLGAIFSAVDEVRKKKKR